MKELRLIFPRCITLLGLVFVGWYPRRDVWGRLRLPPSFELLPEAKRILAEFGGLKFGQRTNFTWFDPSAGEEVVGEIRQFEVLCGHRLYPLGFREHQDREYLLVDESGVIYLLSDGLQPFASSFNRALQLLFWKVQRRVQIDRDLQSTGMAGKNWYIDGPS